MRWSLTKTIQHSHYWTLEGNNAETLLRYNRESHSLRLQSGEKRRLFFLEQSGFLQQRILFKTEYNVLTAESHPAKGQRSGTLILEDRKLLYSIAGDRLLLKELSGETAGSCQLDRPEDMDGFELQALLFGLASIGRAADLQRNSPQAAAGA